jgi:uncharacterized Zn-finger protein
MLLLVYHLLQNRFEIMSQTNSSKPQHGTTIQVKPEQLPLHCPTNTVPVWNQHPKVFLDFDSHGQAKCPYCGAQYHLDGEVKGH